MTKGTRRAGLINDVLRSHSSHLIALEQRMMFDAAAVSAAAETMGAAVAQQQAADAAARFAHAAPAEARDLSARSVDPARADWADRPDHGARHGYEADAPGWIPVAPERAIDTPAASGGGGAIIFIDTSIKDYPSLVAQWSERGTVVLIDPTRDGVEQMRDALAGLSDLDSIHIVSHGEDGAFWLGDTRIDAAAIKGELGTSFAAIGRSLSADGDILIYGCDFGAGEQGKAAMDALAVATGADIAASTDDTGAAAYGGDWNLEAHSGTIEAATLNDPHWDGLLTRTNSGAWTTTGATSATTTSEGVTTTITFAGAGTSTWSTLTNDTFNNIAAFDNSAQATPSLAAVWNSTNTTDVGTITITFSEAVVNPVINLDRLGGVSGTSVSALLSLLTPGATITKLAGPSHFVVDTTARTITRLTGQVTTGTESSLTNSQGSAAGSVRINGTFTTLTFSIRMNPLAVPGVGDGFEIGVAIDKSPDAVNDSFTRNEDAGSFSGSVLTNNGAGADSDPRNDALTVSGAVNANNVAIPLGTATTLPSGATLTLNANGTFTYNNNGLDNALKVGQTRTDTFTYTIRDANGGTDTATASVVITGVNDAPTAVNDTTSTVEDTPVTVTVLTNDSDPDGDALTVSAASALNGTVVRNANGTLTYTPNANYNGADTITYTISDGNGGTSTATVAVTVAAADDPPVNGVPGLQTSPEDGVLVFSTANGNAISISDPDGGIQVVTLTVTKGVLSLGGVTGLTFTQGDGVADTTMTFSGTIAAINQALQGTSYTPTADYNGPAQISIRTINSPTPATGFTNGGFELPNFTGTGIHQVAEASMPGWDTDASDGIIEVWDSGAQGVPAYQGDQFVEINANQAGALFQNFQPGVGSDVSVQFAHRGRAGVDVMRVVATDLGADGAVGGGDDTVLLNKTYSDGTAAWATYTESLTHSATGNIIRFEFRAVSTATGDPTIGNFVDGINIVQGLADFDTIDINVTPVADIANDTATTNEDTAVTINVLANDSFENPSRAITAINGTAIVAGGAAVNVANGTVALNASSQLVFTPAANFNGPASFTYTVTSNGVTETATVAVTVNPVNDAPVAVGTLAGRSNVDAAPVSITTAQAFSDIDNASLTYSATGLPAGLSINTTTGVISGTIDRSASQTTGGVYSITVTATDAGGLAATQAFAWTVTNPGPTATNDSVTTPEDTAVVIPVLANDLDPDGDPLTVTAASAANGAVVRNANGTLTYTPNANFNGTDTISYTISDGQGGVSTATVTVTVTAVNDAPTPVGSLPGRTNADGGGVSVATAGAFQDIDSASLTYSATGLPAGLSINVTTGVISGTIDRSASQAAGGVYSVTVTATDSGGLAATQTFSWTVTNPAPTAANDTASTAEDTPVTITVLANDVDPDGDPLTVTAASAANGAVVRNANGTLTYTPNANFNGTDTISYTISDGQGGVSTATVTVTVTAVNDAPTTTGVSNQIALDGQAINLPLLTAFSDVDGDTLTFGATGLPAGLSINPATGAITGTIDRSASQQHGGVYAITVTANDGRGGVVTTSFTWTITNPAPIAGNDVVTTNEDTAIRVDVLANDVDQDGDPLTVLSASAGHGAVTINADGSLTYTPDHDFNGTDTIIYTITDGEGGQSTATVDITVRPINDNPVTTGLPGQNDADADTVSVPVASAFTDVDGDALTFTASGLPPGLSIDPTTGLITGTLPSNASTTGPYAVTVSATDPSGQTVSASFVWMIQNVPPIANDDVAITNEDAGVTVLVLANDHDPDNDPLQITGATATHGVVVVNGDNSLTFTPDADFNGVAAVTYTITDGQGGFSTATLTVTVNAVNDAPDSQPIPDVVSEDGQAGVSVDVGDFFSDRDGDTLAFTAANLPAGLSIDPATGLITGTIDPAASQVNGGVYTVTITATDAAGLTASRTLTWTVTNPAPTAVSDTATTPEDTPVILSPLANDVDPDGDPLTVTAASATNGVVAINPDGTLRYTPNADFNGTDTIVYTISDGQGGQSTAAISVTVTAVNDPPVAVNDTATTSEDTPVTVAVLANDRDVDGDPLTVTTASAANGTVVVNANGTVTYTPGADFNGTDTITYTISDGHGGLSTATVTVVVNPDNDPPVAANDSATTPEDTPVVIPVLANDSDADGDPLVVSAATALHGAVTRNPDGTLTYTPNADFNGADTITYTISDGQGGTATATVAVTVTAVNDAPRPNSTLPPRAGLDGDAVASVPTAAGFVEVDGDALTYSAMGLPPGLSINAATGVISGTIDRSASQAAGGVYSITVTATDPSGLTATQAFAWTVANPGPIAAADTATTAEDTPVVVPVLANDVDPDGDPLTVITAGALHGTVTINPDGTLTYTPSANFNGADTITYTVSDGQGGMATSTVTVTVTAVNDVPTTAGLPDLNDKDADVIGALPVAPAFGDPDGDPLTYGATGLPPGLSIDPATGVISGTITSEASLGGPNGDGAYRVTVTATDPDGAAVSASFTWNVSNPPPVAVNDAATTAEDTPVIVAVLANDSDPDHDPLTVTAASAAHGTVAINPDGTLTYAPSANFNGADVITYSLFDGKATVTATVAVTVTPVNDAPQAVGSLPPRVNPEATSVSVATAGGFGDVDDAALTYTATGLPPGLTIDPVTGVISGTINRAAAGATGDQAYPVIVTATDAGGLAVTQSFAWTVTNPEPTAHDDVATTSEDTPVVITVLANDVDPDADPLTVTSASAGHGTVTINPDGTISYAPNANFNGADTISYTISDGQGGTSTATVAVTVAAVNDAPVTPGLPNLNDSNSETVSVPVGAAFSDPDGDPLTFSAGGLPAGVSIDPATGQITGTIDPNASTGGPTSNGVYTVTVTAIDGHGGTVSTTFTWQIDNNAPVAGDDSFTTPEDTPVVMNVLTNDIDPDGPLPADPIVDLRATHGVAAINPDGTITFTPDADFNGVATVTYTIIDSHGDRSTASVTITVTPVNDAPNAPVLTDQSGSDGDQNVSVPVGALFSDKEGDALTFAIGGQPAGLAIDPATGVISGTIDPSASQTNGGVYTVTVTATDTGGLPTSRTFTWTVDNPAPVAANDVASTSEDTPVVIPVLANDSDPDNDTLTVTSASATHGTVTVNPDGTLTYTPAADFNGSDTITYAISDGQGGVAVATVSVTVAAVNDAPRLAGGLPPRSGADAEVVTPVATAGGFTDIDDASLTYAASGLPAGLAIDPATGVISGTIDRSASQPNGGVYTVTVTATDAGGLSAEQTFTWTVTNPAPTAADDVATTSEDTPVVIPVLANDADPDLDPLTVISASAAHGTVTINPDGTLTYAPAADFNGADTITYAISDGQGGVSTATVAVTVAAVNDPPIANSDVATTSEDTPVVIPALANDSDVDGDPLTVISASAGHGVVILNPDGTLGYTPAANFNGVDTITYTISDGAGGTATTTVTVTVLAVNDPPVAANDTATTNEDTPVTVAVLANDTDVDGDLLEVTAASAANGVVTINPDGTIVYTPNADFNGVDTITYAISDGHGGVSTATVTVIVNPVNDPPVAANDTATTDEDTPVTIPVLANDGDLDGDPLAVTSASAGHGTVTINPDGTIVYTPNADFNGTDTITYAISDGHGGAATATVTVTVNPVNDPPVAANDTATTPEDTPVTIPVLANDGDLDGDPLTVTAASAANGTVTINADGTIVYTPNVDFNGVDTITYTVSDGAGGTATATVTVTVLAVNDPPVAANDTATTGEDTPVVIPVLANDGDLDGDPLTVVSANAANGRVTINPDGTVTYTPNANFNGTDTITYAISDGAGGFSTATVTVTVAAVNDAPAANPDVATTSEDTPVTIPVLANDSDADGDPLTVTSASAGHGTVTINADGTISYTPDANYNGVDTITYVISDGQGGVSTATVAITVNAVNDPPVANPDVATTNEDTPVVVAVLGNDSDLDGNPLTVTSAGAANGTVTINPDGTLNYAPNANFNGVDTITYTVSDGAGGTATATVTVTVNPVNDPPVAANDTATTNEDTPVVIPVLANDSDLDGDPLTVATASAAHGVVTINPDGTISYTPAANFNGVDTITYTISDGAGGTATATVTVTVNPVNDPPVAANDTATTNEDTSVTIPVLANDSDVDGDPLTVSSATAANGTVTINPDGTISYTPAANFNGVDTITYTVSDGAGGTATATITVTVDPVNDPPVATDDVATTDEDTPVTIPVLANDGDIDGEPLTVTSAGAGHGVVTINPDGTIGYTPNANFNGSDTITYTVSDGAGGTATATVTVTVNAVNDPPTDGPETVNVIGGNPVTIPVLANARDVDGDPLTVAGATASSGVVTINPDGTITYTPDPTFDGVATITYVVSDGKGGLITSTVTLNVTATANADVNQLLEFAAPNIPEALRPDTPHLVEEPFITGPPVIIDAVNAITSLNGGANLDGAQGPVITATNGFGDLGGLAAFDVDGHPVSQEVARLERLSDFRFGADRLFDRRFGDMAVEGLTGFSVQAQGHGQVLVESVVRDSAIYVDIRDTGGGSPIVQYQVRMRDGGPVPAWIQFDARGLAIIEPPAGADTVRLIIRAVREDGSVLETPVIIQSATGEIQIDTSAGEARQVGQAPTLDQAIALAEAGAINEAARLATAFGG